MRPRVFPAEDIPGEPIRLCAVGSKRYPRFNEAAGIPRGRRGGERSRAGGNRGFNEAAGIPRGRRGAPRQGPRCCPGFNEAAGIPRGRHDDPDVIRAPGNASMRPRVFPAEDGSRG